MIFQGGPDPLPPPPLDPPIHTRTSWSNHLLQFLFLVSLFLPVHKILVLWLLSHLLSLVVAKDQTSLCIFAVPTEPSLLAYTKYGCRWKLRSNLRPLAPLYLLKKGVKRFCAYEIVPKYRAIHFEMGWVWRGWERSWWGLVCFHSVVSLLRFFCGNSTYSISD